jgi:hypothetical protein
MKKIIAIVLLSLTASVAISSCTEEEVTPNTVMNGGGGSHEEPKIIK